MSEKNLYNKEAIKKMKEMAESIDFALMQTNLSDMPAHTIPMSTKEVDDQGNIWFLSGKDSEHNANIEKDGNTQLNYADPGSMKFLVVFGQAEIITQPEVLNRLYGKSDDLWFEGANDPNLSAIKFKPEEASYWDSKHNKLVTLLKMGAGIITGDQPDISNSGDLVV